MSQQDSGILGGRVLEKGLWVGLGYYGNKTSSISWSFKNFHGT